MGDNPVSTIIKVIKIKIALNRLSRAKENAVRVHMGYPPIIPWHEKIYIGCMTAIRQCCLETFCPCTIYDRNRHLKRQEIPNSACKRIWKDGTYENEIFKNILGFLGGVLMGIFLYLVMVFQMDFQPITACVIGSVLGPVLTIGLAFSQNVRCIVLLMIPQLFSSKGRTFLMLYCMILVMNHPVKNFNHNIVVMSDSLTCGQQLAYNQTKDLTDSLQSPLAGIMGSIRTVMEALKNFSNTARKAFTALKTAIKEILGCVGRVFQWLDGITDKCNEVMGKPYRKCSDALKEGESKCFKYMPFFFYHFCLIVKVVGLLCNFLRAAQLLCVIASIIKEFVIDKVSRPMESAIDDIYKMFYFNVTVHYDYQLNVTQSKTFSKVKDEIMTEIKGKLNSYSLFVTIVQNIMVFAILFVVFRALYYRRKYLTKDNFDNFYITFKVRDVDERRLEMGKESILPLSWRESNRYIRTTSFWLVNKERTKLAKGLFLLIITGCHVSFYLMCDYGLYWLLDMLRRHFRIKTHTPVPPHLKMHVQGEGPLADMYKALIGLFDPMAADNIKLDTTPCLPNPSTPDYGVYNEIGIIFGICTFMVIFESYGLRLRHVVAACYYPKRERERAVWLYNHILKMRGGFLKFMRRQMRQKYSAFSNKEKISIRSRLAEQFSLCRKLFNFLGWRKKYCLSCGKEGPEGDLDNFIHCASSDCKAVYCMDCFTDLNNLCTVCMDPIDYGDFSDFSEERDSSEDEDEIARKKAEAEERRRNREEARLARRASKRMMDMRLHLGMTDSYVRHQAMIEKRQEGDELSSLVSEESEEIRTGTSSSDVSSDASLDFDQSYQYQDKEDQSEDDFDDYFDDTVQQSFTSELVSTDIFNDERLEKSFTDDLMDYEYDAIEPEDLEMDRETIKKEYGDTL